jgi:hypothetical protein
MIQKKWGPIMKLALDVWYEAWDRPVTESRASGEGRFRGAAGLLPAPAGIVLEGEPPQPLNYASGSDRRIDDDESS